MKELVMLAVGMEMTRQMKEADAIARVNAAETKAEKIAIVQETEKFCFNTANEIFKSDEEIGEEGIKAKEELIKGLVEAQYKYFELPNPFEQGMTFTEVKERNGFGKPEVQEDEFFTN